VKRTLRRRESKTGRK